MKIQRTIAVLLTVGAVAAGSAGAADAATKRKAPKAAATCTIAKLDSATARHTAQYNPKELGVDGITATDDWETVSMLCNNENVTGKVRARRSSNSSAPRARRTRPQGRSPAR